MKKWSRQSKEEPARAAKHPGVLGHRPRGYPTEVTGGTEMLLLHKGY